ncbi:MAG: serine hydrolase domain-containing protein, partial [Gemmatimonadales bacterium]
RTVSTDSLPLIVGRREFQAAAREMAQRAITLVQEGPLETFRTEHARTALVLYGEESNLFLGDRLTLELRRLGEAVSSFRLYPASGPASYDSARAVIAANPRTAFAVSVRAISGRGDMALPDSLAALILATDTVRPTVLASLGSPYLLDALPGFSGAYLIAWSDSRITEQAVAHALAGRAPIGGRLPISLGPEYPIGHGIHLRAVERQPEQPDTARLRGLTEFLARQAEEGAFPGGVLLVGYRGSIAHVAAVGRYGLDDPRPVSDSTIYDLASLTKVIGLTTGAMMLVAEGRLELDRPVQEYLPAFRGPGKERVTVRHLLTHTSGLEAWVPLHLSTADREAALERVNTSELQSAPGSRYVYSDLGAIVLTEVVEAVAGESLDRFLESRLFAPLGMRDTRFRPPAELLPRIAPTELDPWRGRMIRGEVHDENAAHLGGVSGHAGLFSTAPDLARFAFWLLDAYHERLAPGTSPYLPAKIVRMFTRKQPGPEGSTRALGWDTPNPEGGGSAGSMLSPASFGHTGFTGTSIWIDPVRELVVILLTNRVHPSRENRALLGLRGMVADSVVSALFPRRPP